MPKDPCNELAATITRLAMNIGADPEVKSLDDVVDRLQKLLPEMNLTRAEIVNSIVDATSGHRQATTELQDKLNQLKREARTDASLRSKITAAQRNLAEGTLPATRARPVDRSSDVVKQLREVNNSLQRDIRGSDPAVIKRLSEQIASLTDRLENGVQAPAPPKARTPTSREAERLAYERDRLRRQVNQKIRDLQPKSVFEKTWAPAREALNLARTLMTTFDISAVLRQGLVTTLTQPILSAKALRPTLEAMLDPVRSHAINQAILDRPLAPLADRSKLFISEHLATPTKQEEAFMGRLAERIPIVRNFERAYTTFLNVIRADTFDTLVRSAARNGMPTDAEAKAIANYVNVATGRAKLPGSLERAANEVNTVFFAPRYVVSRFEYLMGQPLWGGTARTRALIAKEYAKAAIGVGVVLALGAAAGGVIERDPRSSDFGKIRFGNTVVDMTGGLSQVATLFAREASGSTKTASGEIAPLRGPRRLFGEKSAMDVITSFGRGKLAPLTSVGADLLTGQDMGGNPATIGNELSRMVIPIGFSDVVKAMQDQGVPKGTALSILSFFGAGVNTYQPQNKRGIPPKIKERMRNEAERKYLRQQAEKAYPTP